MGLNKFLKKSGQIKVKNRNGWVPNFTHVLKGIFSNKEQKKFTIGNEEGGKILKNKNP